MSKQYDKYFKDQDIPQTPEPHTTIKEPSVKEIKPKTYIVKYCKNLNVRSEPNKDGSILDTISEEEQVQVADIINGWAHIQTDKGICGYVMDEYIKEE